MSDQYRGRNLEQRIIKDADQTEFAAILRNSVLVDAGLFDDKVSGALDDFESGSSVVKEIWHELDLKFDTAVGKIHEELTRRAELMGEYYPFKLEDSQIKYIGSSSYFYEFCLAVSTSQTITEGEFVFLPRYFERLSAILVKSYMGCDSFCVHVGSPRDTEMGSTFYSSMQKVNEITGEWIWSPLPPFPAQPTSTGDEGMDFIVWKNAPDKRPGKLFVVGQCACGDDWKDKFHDLNLEKLGKWFRQISYVKPPVRSFTTPHHLSDINLINAQNEAGLVFDRARLTIIAERNQTDEFLNWTERMKTISSKVINEG